MGKFIGALVIVLCMMFHTSYSQGMVMDTSNPDIISSAVLLSNGTVVTVYINSTELENNYNNNPCPCVNHTELQADRLEVLKLWAARTNYNHSYILDLYDTLATPDLLPNGSISEYLHQFIVAGFASYSANTVAAEYALEAVDPNSIQLFSELDLASVVWQADNISVSYKIITNYSLAMPNIPGGQLVLSGFVNDQYARFVPCETEIWIDISIQDSLIGTYLAQQQTNRNATEICDIIMTTCTGENQVYPTYDACVDYMSAVVAHNSPCPGGLIANSSGCHYFHAKAARNLPVIHCQHVRPYDSPVCQDFCLDQGCGNCDVNAECTFISNPGKLIPQYQCKCKSGYTGDGVTCTPNTCTGNWQCPSNYNYGTCTNGLCGCKSSTGFNWIPTQEAVSQNNACQCAENENVYWYNGNPECIPIGRCREAWQCPQAATQYTSITCSAYGTNVLVPFNTCRCNYGYSNPGFSYNCQCPSNRRELWSNVKSGTLCLSSTECTDNYHCSSNDCIVAPGQWLGTCAA
ncbi:egf domain-containing protein [Cotonvirus japonicus]|uniref:Egf domain-containing protein n=1 Tax=Cotonvirus japonicus TaxID=2811091 RepID=A0ABM7NTR3_9VIRU|nr:egf domain-containing protein [Cotonvirus japonicus]BCS83491.1 egf domain-containing protein [Cotonvirus japonicus]